MLFSKVIKMKLIAIIILLCVLAIPASASTVVSWKQTDITGHNLTLNYTSSFIVTKNDIMNIFIKNIGNETLNDNISVKEIKVLNREVAEGRWTGSVDIMPNSSKTIDFTINFTTDDKTTVNIKIYYEVNSDSKSLNINANYRGEPASSGMSIISWNNNKTNDNNRNLIINEMRTDAVILTWSPLEVVNYVYVNDTVSETIEYSITLNKYMTDLYWTLDGEHVDGYEDKKNTYSYMHTWDNNSLGFHTIKFRGSNADTNVEFKWYVYVYEIGGYRGGGLFDVIDDELENHATDIKFQIFKHRIEKDVGKSAIATRKVNQLHDEIAQRKMTREALRKKFKAGDIKIEQYVAAMKQIQRDEKYNMKFVKKMEEIENEDKHSIDDGSETNKNKKKGDNGAKGKSEENQDGNKNRGHDD